MLPSCSYSLPRLALIPLEILAGAAAGIVLDCAVACTTWFDLWRAGANEFYIVKKDFAAKKKSN